MGIGDSTLGSFSYYLGLGVERSYAAVADHYGASKTAVANLARRENWQGRLLDVERKARQTAEEKAVPALSAEPVGNSLEDGMDCVRALDLAIKGEPLILAEPTERHATDIEAIVKREHERWLVWRQPERGEVSRESSRGT